MLHTHNIRKYPECPEVRVRRMSQEPPTYLCSYLPVHTFPLGDNCPLGFLSGSHLCVFLTGEFRVLNHKIQLALYSTPMRKAWLLTDLNCSYFIFSSASYFVAGSLRPPRRRECLLWVRMWPCISAGCVTSNES